MKRVIPNLVGAAVLTLLFAATSASAAAGQRSGDQFQIKRSGIEHVGQDYVESIDMLFEVDERGVLVLGTTIGTVNVRTWSENMVRLVVKKRAHAVNAGDARRILDMFRVQALREGSDLQFTAHARTEECARNVDVTFTVWVPKSYDLEIKTRSGDIEIPKMDGRFSAHTAEGKISVDCDTENLDIEVEDNFDSDAEESDGSPLADTDDEGDEPSVNNGAGRSGSQDQ